VTSVSRLTDPVFFADRVVKELEENYKKPLTDPTRIFCVQIWTKHDGKPLQRILEACKKYRVAPMVSFSITGLGDTAIEKGVMRYKDMLERVGKLVKIGLLNPVTTTVRIDPILVGVTNMKDIKNIVLTCKKFGIKKFVTSLMQSYGYLDDAVTVGKGISNRYYLYKDKDVERLKQRFPNFDIAEAKKDDEGYYKLYNSKGEEISDKGMPWKYSDRHITKELYRAVNYDWDKYYGRNSTGCVEFKPKQ
jgi:DNA repair photolyase